MKRRTFFKTAGTIGPHRIIRAQLYLYRTLRTDRCCGDILLRFSTLAGWIQENAKKDNENNYEREKCSCDPPRISVASHPK